MSLSSAGNWNLVKNMVCMHLQTKMSSSLVDRRHKWNCQTMSKFREDNKSMQKSQE